MKDKDTCLCPLVGSWLLPSLDEDNSLLGRSGRFLPIWNFYWCLPRWFSWSDHDSSGAAPHWLALGSSLEHPPGSIAWKTKSIGDCYVHDSRFDEVGNTSWIAFIRNLIRYSSSLRKSAQVTLLSDAFSYLVQAPVASFQLHGRVPISSTDTFTSSWTRWCLFFPLMVSVNNLNWKGSKPILDDYFYQPPVTQYCPCPPLPATHHFDPCVGHLWIIGVPLLHHISGFWHLNLLPQRFERQFQASLLIRLLGAPLSFSPRSQHLRWRLRRKWVRSTGFLEECHAGKPRLWTSQEGQTCPLLSDSYPTQSSSPEWMMYPSESSQTPCLSSLQASLWWLGWLYLQCWTGICRPFPFLSAMDLV